MASPLLNYARVKLRRRPALKRRLKYLHSFQERNQAAEKHRKMQTSQRPKKRTKAFRKSKLPTNLPEQPSQQSRIASSSASRSSGQSSSFRQAHRQKWQSHRVRCANRSQCCPAANHPVQPGRLPGFGRLLNSRTTSHFSRQARNHPV